MMLKQKLGELQQPVAEVVTVEEMEETEEVEEVEMGEMEVVMEEEMENQQLRRKMVGETVRELDQYLWQTSSSAVEPSRVGCATLSEVGTRTLACYSMTTHTWLFLS